jgi:hypothetical protein
MYILLEKTKVIKGMTTNIYVKKGERTQYVKVGRKYQKLTEFRGGVGEQTSKTKSDSGDNIPKAKSDSLSIEQRKEIQVNFLNNYKVKEYVPIDVPNYHINTIQKNLIDLNQGDLVRINPSKNSSLFYFYKVTNKTVKNVQDTNNMNIIRSEFVNATFKKLYFDKNCKYTSTYTDDIVINDVQTDIHWFESIYDVYKASREFYEQKSSLIYSLHTPSQSKNSKS